MDKKGSSFLMSEIIAPIKKYRDIKRKLILRITSNSFTNKVILTKIMETFIKTNTMKNMAMNSSQIQIIMKKGNTKINRSMKKMITKTSRILKKGMTHIISPMIGMKRIIMNLSRILISTKRIRYMGMTKSNTRAMRILSKIMNTTRKTRITRIIRNIMRETRTIPMIRNTTKITMTPSKIKSITRGKRKTIKTTTTKWKSRSMCKTITPHRKLMRTKAFTTKKTEKNKVVKESKWASVLLRVSNRITKRPHTPNNCNTPCNKKTNKWWIK